MRLRTLLERHYVEALAAALAAVGVVEGLAGFAEASRATAVGVALLATLPLLARRRFPLVAPAVVFAALAALSVARPEAVKEAGNVVLFALLLAFWIVGAHGGLHQAVAGAAVGFAALAVIARRADAGPLEDDPLLPGGAVQIGAVSFDIIFVLSLAAGAWLVAYALQRRAHRASALEERAARLEREREDKARAAVAEERGRIARDLRDVITHSVSVMTVQAGAARLLLMDEPTRARALLTSVEETGRQALAEMRRLLGILREQDSEAALAPQPGLAQLEELLARARRAGLPVELTIEGEPRALPTGVDLAAYRIVQDALTNARKHAEPARTQVVVRYGRTDLELEVVNDGGAPRNGDSGAESLVGMRERVTLYGGELEAGAREGGGFSVWARLPLELEETLFASALSPKRWRHERTSRAEPHAVGDAPRLRARLRPDVFDALVVGLAIVSEIEIWVTSVPGPKVVLVPAVLLWTLPLLWRRRFPFAAPAFAFAVQALAAFAGDEVGSALTSFAAYLLTFWAVGAGNGRHQALAGAAIGFASIAVVADQDVRVDSGDMASVIVSGGALTLIAYALQRRAGRESSLEEQAARLEQEREERAQVAVGEERRRIARELHDVIAHSVTLMTVQAGAARLLLAEDPERAREPVLSVEETGRHALAELRRLLGILRPEQSEASLVPQPGLARIDDLLTRTRRGGLPVELAVAGEPRALPPGVDLTAYRIVQEALTNAHKHAGPARAHVFLRYGIEALELEVTDDGQVAPNGGDGVGHGLVGMRERVALYDGTFEAGPSAEGGYVVRARLPVAVSE
jgi:signal transduction histidine kinase